MRFLACTEVGRQAFHRADEVGDRLERFGGAPPRLSAASEALPIRRRIKAASPSAVATVDVVLDR